MSNNTSKTNENRVASKLTDVSLYNHKQFAELFHKFNQDRYIFSDKTGWYGYDKNNILVSYGKDLPTDMLNTVQDFLCDYIKQDMKGIDVVDDYSKKAFDNLFKAYDKVSSSQYTSGILKQFKVLYLDNDLDEKIDANTYLFAFKDKVYDITSGEYRDIEKKDYILRNTGYIAPELTTDYSLIDNLIMSIFEDREVADYFLLITAMSLFTNKFEKLYILTGNGRNGKGVVSSIIQKALGKYYLTGANDLLTCKDEMKNETLAKATGIRYLAISEPAEDSDKELKFNISMVKKLTGRDELSVRALYKNSLEYIPRFTVFVSCNEPPTVDETNDAIRNRFRFIHFPFTFVENPSRGFERKIDVNLKDKIDNETEYRDIMISYLLDILHKNQDIKKIKEPAKCNLFTNTYFDNNSDVANFLEKYFTITDDSKDKIRPNELYQMFSADGDYKKLSTVKFASGLKSANIKKEKINGSLYYVGIKKKTINEEDSDDSETEKDTKKNALDL